MIEEEPLHQGPQDKLAFRTAYLIAGYIKEDLTQSEHEELDDWVTSSMENQRLFEELTDGQNLEKLLQWKDNLQSKQVLERLKGQLEFTSTSRASRLRRIFPYMIAASLLSAILSSVVIYQNNSRKAGSISRSVVSDIMPGDNKAILTLSDGSTISLDKAKKGSIYQTSTINIVKQKNGEVKYQVNNEASIAAELEYNSLATPKGGQFQIILPDMTKVWLNAASSLRYPTSFTGKERSVELKGEGYFEVTTDARRPFIVSANGTTVKVLGTHFNVNAYTDEPTVNITLAEGSVKVNESVTINPGQQAEVSPQHSIKTVTANLGTTMAWKEGVFNFKNASIEEVMRQVSRWYDANISFQAYPQEHFNGTISRNEPVTKLLHLLERTGSVHFKIENKNIIVLR